MKLPAWLKEYAAYAAWYIPPAFFRPLFTLAFRVKCKGLEKVPIKGGVLLACNHGTYLDPPFLGTYLPRKFHFIAKSDLFKYPGLKEFCQAEQCLMVRRGEPDRKVLLEAVEKLQAGEAVLIFPEGTRIVKGFGPAEAGVGLIALRSQAPVVPVALRGHRKAWPHRTPIPCFFMAQVEILVGDPVDLSDLYEKRPRGKAAHEAAERIMAAIAELHAQGTVPDND